MNGIETVYTPTSPPATVVIMSPGVLCLPLVRTLALSPNVFDSPGVGSMVGTMGS